MISYCFKLIALFAIVTLLTACTGIPTGVEPVNGFELERYLGKWYEIARLDHSFERGLINVTADYSLREDGGMAVINRGFNPQTEEWEQAVGKAYFIRGTDTGRLKVSFFGPFYGGYNIFALDRESYGYSLVAGPDHSYLWILARTPELEPSLLDALVRQARDAGFATDELIYVDHQ